MLNLTKLLFPETQHFGDHIRYSQAAHGARHGATHGGGPVVVWQMTRTCNLFCQHCYASSEPKRYPGELTGEEARTFLDDLSGFKVPVLLLSGGEPFVRPDFWQLAEYAVQKGLRATISTNGTLIDPDSARRLKSLGVGYAGISIDGVEETHDRVRGRRGAYRAALAGIRNCRDAGVRTGIRFTVHRWNVHELPEVLFLAEREGVDRICIYHLVYSGRGGPRMDISHAQTRRVMDQLIRQVELWHRRGVAKEVLTVDNHADGIYLYLKYKDRDPDRAEHILQMLRRNGGNRVGSAIAFVDHKGGVHPDQFTTQYNFGNVKEQPFSRIWTEGSHPILAGLRDRRERLKGRCSTCAWLETCNGNFRTRAEAVTGDYWESDPACYLNSDEIASAPDLAGVGD